MKSARFAIIVAVLIVLSTAARADLHDPNNSADYLIVTTQGLISANPWIGNLAAWRTAHGRTAMVVPVETVWNEFGSGVPSDTVLKGFLHYARRHWQAPQLRDVFIIGSYDVVPWHVEPDSTFDGSQWERMDFLSDFFYATEPESSNFIPVLSIGRLPWSPQSGTPLWNYYDKVTAYEDASGDWQALVHLVADSSVTGYPFTFADMVESWLASQVHPGYAIERDYLASPPGDPFHGDREEILANLNAGSYLMAYWGHWDSTQWSPDSMRIDSADLAELRNGNRLPIVLGSSIITYAYGSIVSFMPIPLAFLANSQGGAIGYVGSTTVTWVMAGLIFRSHLTSLATSDSVATLGDIWRMTEVEVVTSYWWPGFPNTSFRPTVMSCTLFGDPGLRLPPRPSSVPPASPSVATRFQIAGCYPNPFNATTRIEFDLPHQTHVSLRVYDVTGRLAATLLDEIRAAGRHAVVWDAAGLGSGVYFAVLESPSSRAVHKVVLLK